MSLVLLFLPQGGHMFCTQSADIKRVTVTLSYPMYYNTILYVKDDIVRKTILYVSRYCYVARD